MRTHTINATEHVTIIVTSTPDEWMPGPDGDCYDDAARDSFGHSWGYADVTARVMLDGVEIAEDSLGMVEEGMLPTDDGEEIECDPLEMTPAKRFEAGAIMMGSPAWEVVGEAVALALAWVHRNGNPTAVDELNRVYERHALPEAP